MKIIQIINSLGTGGAEKLLLETIPLYRERGVEMDVLVFWNNNHQFIDELRALNCCKIIMLKESGNYKDIYSLSHIWKLRKYLKEYDIAHVHLFPAQYFTVLANISIRNRCKLIFTEHNTTNKRIQKIYFKPIERLIYSRYEKIVCISDEIQLIYKKYLSIDKKNRFVLIPNGIDIKKISDSIAVRKSDLYKSLNNNKKFLLQVSAFRPQKDQQTLIRAMSLLSNDIILLLVGDGETRKECESLVLELALNDRVFFLGQRMDIPQLLKTADIVVLSSKYEGLSLSSIEGMASGRPFIASNVPGLSEIVTGAGVLFEYENENDLANEIIKLLENKGYYDKVVESCLVRAEQYDISLMIDKHIELYKSIY